MHTKTTMQLVNKRSTLIFPDTQSNELNEDNTTGLFNNDFFITILEIQFPNVRLGLYWRKKQTVFSKVATTQPFGSLSSGRMQERPFCLRFDSFCTFAGRVFLGVVIIHPFNRIQ